jgi:hypothetical protein
MEVDSVITSGLGVAWVGNVNDKYFGKISASSYMSFSLPDFNVSETAIFDSLTMVIKSNPDYYGDTTKIQKFYIYQLTNAVALNNKGYLYRSSIVDTIGKDSLLGEFIIKPRPKNEKTFEARLKDRLGIDFLQNFINKTSKVESDNNFRQYFKGIALVPENTGNSLISSFLVTSSGIALQLHYHYKYLGRGDHIISIIPNSILQFNHIDQDKTGTLIENLPPQNGLLNSTNTGNIAFMQGITGISTILEFPDLDNLLLLGKTVYISSAQLIVKPIPGSHGSLTLLPDSLLLQVFEYSSYNTSISSGMLALNSDLADFGINMQYSTDITQFMQNQLGAILNKKEFVKLSLPIDSRKNSLRRLLIGNGQNLQSQANIELKLMIYDTN